MQQFLRSLPIAGELTAEITRASAEVGVDLRSLDALGLDPDGVATCHMVAGGAGVELRHAVPPCDPFAGHDPGYLRQVQAIVAEALKGQHPHAASKSALNQKGQARGGSSGPAQVGRGTPTPPELRAASEAGCSA